MAIPSWPPGLPQVPQKGFSETGGVIIIRTPTDKGPAKMRRRGSKPSVLNLSFIMTTEQVSTLETFVETTLGGVRRFNFTHPRTGIQEEFRLVPQSEGDLYNITYLAPDYWTVTAQFELLP